MTKEYMVLYKRDLNGERMDIVKGRLLYDRIEEFETKDSATRFALDNLQTDPILARQVLGTLEPNLDLTYIVAAKFKSKYKHYDYTGDWDYVPSHDVLRVPYQDLNETITELASEKPAKVYLGIEEKLFPDVMDQIRSINKN